MAMATKDVVLTKLNTIYNDLNNSDRMTAVLRDTSLWIFDVLVGDRLVPVDSDIIQAYQRIHSRLGAMNGELTAELATVVAELTAIGAPTNVTRSRWEELNRDRVRLTNAIANRPVRELTYNDLFVEATHLENIPVGAVNSLTVVGGVAVGNLATNFDTVTVAWAIRNYDLVLRNGTILRPDTAGNYIYTHNGVPYTLRWITFNRNTGNITIAGFSVTPDTPFNNLELGVRANTQLHSLNLYRDKNLTITLPNVSLHTSGLRQPVLCAYNTAGGGVLQRILNQTYDIQHETMEREAIFAVLRRNDPSNKLDSLTPDQQQEAYRVLRQLYLPLGWNIGRAAMVNYAGANSFEEWFTGDNHPGSRLPHNRNATTYTDYIHANHPQEIQRYMRERFEREFSTLDNSRFLKANFLDFLTTLQERQQDSFVDRTLDHRNLPHMQNHKRINAFGRDIFGRRDVNYLRFFAGQDTTLQNETLTLQNENWSPETISYDMNLRIESAQNISVTISSANITGGVPLTFPAGDPSALIRKVLRSPAIPYGKQRVHIAYNIVRSFITLAQSKNIPLQYLVPGTNNQINRLEMQWANVVLANSNVNVGTRRDAVTTLFDYNQHFASSQNWENGGTSLEYGIYSMMNHFNSAMEQTHQQYRNAITTRCLSSGDKLNTRVSLSRWKNPIKSLFNIGKQRKFDFDVQETINGRQVAIAFRNNRFYVGLEGYEKPFEWTSLSSILNTRVKGRRVFDGMELDVLALVNRNLLTTMRQNTKIENSLIAARDPITGRLYFIDTTTDGSLKFSYVDAYDTRHFGPGAYNYDQEMSRARTGKQITNAVWAGLLGAGAGILWAGAVAAGATVSWIAQWAWSAFTGVGFFNRMKRIFQRWSATIPSGERLVNYGIIHRESNLVAGRQNCQPHEEEALLRNSVVMGRFYKAMKHRMGGFESMRAFWSNVA